MVETKMHLKVSDYTMEPFGRYPSDGEGNGETYRKNILIPALNKGLSLVIHLDGVSDEYGSSFLVEAFANLIRKDRYSYSEIKDKIEFVSHDKNLIEEIKYYLSEANAETNKNILR